MIVIKSVMFVIQRVVSKDESGLHVLVVAVQVEYDIGHEDNDKREKN